MRSLFLLIFCLFAFPCQAENFPCVLLGAPCYIKSNPIILREKPSFDAKIIEKFHPAKDGEWDGYYLADVFPKDGKPIWGFFKQEGYTFQAIGNIVYQSNGWIPLEETFLDVNQIDAFGEKISGAIVTIKPDKYFLYVNDKESTAFIPLDTSKAIIIPN
ncbi:MAG: hypothetical protein IJ846_04715 [Alphaproteobacteria bacterium]|nr:hypothetical protein [Alphaproteobacteria bacterium]